MAIVGGLTSIVRQVTFDHLDTVRGQARRGRIDPACRQTLRGWLGRFAGRNDVTFAVEGCIGWRFVVEELRRAGSVHCWLSRPRPRISGAEEADEDRQGRCPGRRKGLPGRESLRTDRGLRGRPRGRP